MEKELDNTKKTIEEFFKKTTFEVGIQNIKKEGETLFVDLKTEEPQILIGEGGQTLNEIQHILKAILKRKSKEVFYLDIDINEYKKKKAEYLKEMARAAADEVALTGKEKDLPSMSAYERRIIHLELQTREDVSSRSEGEEPQRRIIVFPK